MDFDFTEKGVSGWEDQTPDSISGSVVLDINASNSRLHVTSGDAQKKKIRRRVDASTFHGKRVLASIHTTVRADPALGSAVARMSVQRSSQRADAWNLATSQHLKAGSEESLEMALDIPDDARSLEIELEVMGPANVWFDVPQLSMTTTPAFSDAPLSQDVADALRSLAHLVGYLRFFHPSDQVASAEWGALETEVVTRMLAARGIQERQDVLKWLVAATAPAAQLYIEGARLFPQPPPRNTGTKLTRWVRIGSGNDGEPYSAFRTEISEPGDVGITLVKTVPSQGCKHAKVRFTASIEQSSPVFKLYIVPRRGSGSPGVVSHVVGSVGSIEADIPPEVTNITYGVHVGGVGATEVSEIELLCGESLLGSFAAAGSPEIFGTAKHLYLVTPSVNCEGCFTVVRHSQLEYQASRDEIDISIGLGLRLHMPLALWTDGKRTFPEASSTHEMRFHPLPPGDLASRITSAIDIWVTLKWFYPYFDDLHIDWEHALSEALVTSAISSSADELFFALERLVAVLKDDHAAIYRPEYDNGVLPLNFYYLDSKLYVIGGIGEFRSTFPRGATLDSLDGVPADVLIGRATAAISAATPAWLHANLPLTIGEGPIGAMVAVRVKRPDGIFEMKYVPRLAGKFFRQKREERPTNGTEIASGVYYLDFATMDQDTLKRMLPQLANSRGVICDARGGASPAAFQILAHFIDHEIKSPYWDKPIASTVQKIYERSQASIYPSPMRLSIKLVFVVDGRTASSPETILQYARAAGIGVVVGEPTGGTNGDVATFSSLGGLHVQFTGLRVLNQDGSEFHGRGITPDIVVHPTVSGIQAGRDEILEAAVSRVTNP